MTQMGFLLELHEKLSCLPEDEIEERLTFYNEMIADRMEEGFSEEEAVASVGSVDEIASQIIADASLIKLVKAKMKPKKRYGAGVITLLILGFPLWFVILLMAFAVVLSLYIILWAVVLSLWAVEVSLWGAALFGVTAGLSAVSGGHLFTALVVFGIAVFAAGFSVFFFFGCLGAAKGSIFLTKKIVFAVKRSFIKRREHDAQEN